MKILFVEDDESYKKTVADYLRKAGYEVYATDDVNEAKGLFECIKPDIIITDVVLKTTQSGYALCKWIRERDKDIPVIVATSRDSKLARFTAKSSGATDFITKPYSPEFLLRKIKKIEKNE